MRDSKGHGIGDPTSRARPMSPGIPRSPPAHKCMGFFMYPQENIAVDYEQLAEQDRQLQRLQLQQLHLPGLRFSDEQKNENLLLNKEVESAATNMPASFYQHLPDWDKQNTTHTGTVLCLCSTLNCCSWNL